ncbi:proline racemase [Colletotrichum acutatum]|uniref:Proline racemase n=1 Tax=Glomerella acutata TaxID=27357 RepID=A0AAD8UDD1_GLOAC|nr:proline racemase [Colletotrichum acutatum]KAK1720365.1 proline racemase [Colletotrichum acutatum]
MSASRVINVVGCHAEGEVGDVITGGVLDVPAPSMWHKLQHFLTHKDELRQLLLNEPRGRSPKNTNLILPPCNPEAAAGFLIMESEEYAPMSGSNTICTATVLLQTGMIPMQEPITKFSLDTAAGLVGVTAECQGGKCKSVAFENVPAFVDRFDLQVDVPGIGTVSADIVWGGMWYAIVDATSVGMTIEPSKGAKLVELGERIKSALKAAYTPHHPENPEIKGISVLEFTEPLHQDTIGKVAKNTVVVSPGRFDRSPCGTGTSARMALLHAKGQLAVGEYFKHTSVIDTAFECRISRTVKVGDIDAVVPIIKGRAWITSYKQVVLDPEDPFPTGFRVGDQWHVPDIES